jgi:hypothetical protein
MDLRAAYLNKKSLWYSFGPRSARENRLLVIQGSAEECRFYDGLGWETTSLAFAIGLSEGFASPGKCISVSAWADSWPCDGMKYDALVCNQAGSTVTADTHLMRRVVALLSPSGTIRIRLQNPEYFGDTIFRRGHEIWPQPQDFPHGASLGVEALKSSLSEFGCELIDVQEDVDPMYHNPEMSKWPAINGWDCSVYLPQDPSQRKQHFIKSWVVALKHQTTLEALQGVAPQNTDLNVVHAEIEELLDDVRLDEAGLILDKLFQSGEASAETCNLQGVLHFYRKKHRDAWNSFRMAILLDGTRLDFFQNLADVAPHAGTVPETLVMLAKAKGRVPGVEEIEIDV